MTVVRVPTLGFGCEGNREINFCSDLFALVLTQRCRNFGVWDGRTEINAVAGTMVTYIVVAVKACSMSTCSAEEEYFSICTGQTGHLIWAMMELSWCFLRFPCIADDLPRPRCRTLLGCCFPEYRKTKLCDPRMECGRLPAHGQPS